MSKTTTSSLCLALLLLAAACGSDGDAQPVGATEPTAATETASTAEPDPTTTPVPDLAETIVELGREHEAVVFRLLPKERAISVFELLPFGRYLANSLAALQGRVPGNPFMPLTGWLECELWGEWSRETGHRVGGVTDLRDALFSNDYQDMRLERVNYRFQWRFRSPTDWNLHVADFFFDDGVDSWTTPRVSMARDTRRDLGLWISADRLPLGVPLQLTRDVMSVYENPWPGWLPDSIDGGVRELDLVLGADWRLRLLQADVSDAQVAGSSDMPAVRGLDARIDIDSAGAEIRLNGGSNSDS